MALPRVVVTVVVVAMVQAGALLVMVAVAVAVAADILEEAEEAEEARTSGIFRVLVMSAVVLEAVMVLLVLDMFPHH